MTDRVTVDMRSEVVVSFGVGILDKSAAGWMRVAVKSSQIKEALFLQTGTHRYLPPGFLYLFTLCDGRVILVLR